MARLIIIEDNRELAALLAASAGGRGYAARVAATGHDARRLLSTETFDAAIVDLLLPDAKGSELLVELKRKGVPAVAMSGVFRGDRYAREAVEKHGAIAFFEKPFDLRRLLETLDKATSPAGLPLGGEPITAPEELPDEAPPDELAGVARWDEHWRRRQRPPPPPRDAREVPGWAESGQITAGSIPRVLTAYFQARHDGELVLRQRRVQKVIAFRDGRATYAASNLSAERFGRFCVRRGALTEPDLARAEELVRTDGLRTADALLRLGLLSAERREALVAAQVREIIWSTFAWAEGDFAARMASPRQDLMPLSLPPAPLVLEGVLATEPLVSLRIRVAPGRRLFPTADPPYGLDELPLSGGQALLVAYADGSKTVEDLLALTDLPEREALATLYALELLGMVEERREDGKQRRISFGI